MKALKNRIVGKKQAVAKTLKSVKNPKPHTSSWEKGWDKGWNKDGH